MGIHIDMRFLQIYVLMLKIIKVVSEEEKTFSSGLKFVLYTYICILNNSYS